MRAHAFLDAAEQLPLVGVEDLLGEGGAVVVAPHADDESLGCGALIAAAAALGRKVRVLILSDGVGSHPNSPSYPPARLRALREAEARSAVNALGLDADNLKFLGLPDRFVPAKGAGADRAAECVARACKETAARAIFVTWRHDPHCDHRAAYEIARAAQRQVPGARLFEYPIWGRSLPDDAAVEQPVRGVRLDGLARRARKQAAIMCHRSQLTDLIDDDPEGFRLSAADLVRFSGHEVFLECEP